MKLDLSCPIELRGYALDCDEKNAAADVRLYNLTARRIDAFDAVVKWRSGETGRSIATPVTLDHLRAAGESEFHVHLASDRLQDADSLELLITSVRFDDGLDPWRSGNGLVVPLEPLPAIAARELAALRSCAGEDAVCYPEQQALTWRCVCGRPNPDDAVHCARCHRDRADALRFTPGYVQNAMQSADVASLVREDADALRSRYRRHRKCLFFRTMTTALALLALVAMFLLQTQASHKVPADNTAMIAENK